MNNFQKFWMIIGKITEWMLITMVGISIMGCIAAVVQPRMEIFAPMAISAGCFYGLIRFNRKVNWFIIRMCAK